AHEVDAEGVVNRDHGLVGADDSEVEDVLGVEDLERGVVVDDGHVIVVAASPGDGDADAGMYGLALVGDDAAGVELRQAGGGQLGVDAEVVLTIEGARGGHPARGVADANLDGGAIGHKLVDVGGDGASAFWWVEADAQGLRESGGAVLA